MGIVDLGTELPFLPGLTSFYFESGREDLNLRPHGPEPCALAMLSYAPSLLAIDEILANDPVLSIAKTLQRRGFLESPDTTGRGRVRR